MRNHSLYSILLNLLNVNSFIFIGRLALELAALLTPMPVGDVFQDGWHVGVVML